MKDDLNTPKNEIDILFSIEDAKGKGEKEIFESLISAISLFEKEYDYVSIVEVIDENISSINDAKYKTEIINKKINALLKLEDYNELLKTLTEKEAIKELDQTQKTNILFYKAIAYEALDETDLSIESLEAILDNIPKYSLINKYLKLSMLYLKVSKIDKAKEAYDYASLVDHSHSNDMFYLVESDLYYKSSKYLDALESFESFFLRSNNRYKYLDRYILINIALKRYDDAYKFYMNYIDKPSLRLSSGNRYQFLKSVALLFEKMGKEKELDEIKCELERIKPIYFKRIENDNLSIIDTITQNMTLPLTKYDKRKNIANKFFKLLNKIEKNTLVFIEYYIDGYKYSKFNNTQLKEKEILKVDVIDKSLVDYFDLNEDKILNYYYNDKLEKVEEKVKCYFIGNEYIKYGFFMVSYDENYDYIYKVLKNSLFELFLRLDSICTKNDDYNNLLMLLENENTGLIKINNNFVEFKDSYSKKLFNSKLDVMKTEDFSSIFFDEFDIPYLEKVKKKSLRIINDLETKYIEFKSTLIDDNLYALVSDVTLKKERKERLENFYYYSDTSFYNENSLKKDIDIKSSSYAIIGLYIPIVEEMDTFDLKNKKLKELSKYFDSIQKELKIYMVSLNHFIIMHDSIDKRTLESLYRKIKENIQSLYRISQSLRFKDINGFISKSLKGKSFDEVKSLIEYGFYNSYEKNDLLVIDNDEKRDYSLFQIYAKDIETKIKENSLKIDYYPIIDEKTNSIHYFFPQFRLPKEINHSIFERILNKYDLESRADFELISLTFQNHKKIKKDIRYIIPIHKESVMNTNFIKKLSVQFKENDLFGKVIIYIDYIDNNSFKKGIDSMINSGLKLATSINLLSFDSINKFKVIFFSNKNTEFEKHFLNSLSSINKTEIVLTDGENIGNNLSFRNNFRLYSLEDIIKL